MKRYRGGVRDVEAGERVVGRDVREAIARLARQFAQALAFRSHHQCRRSRPVEGFDALFAFAVEADNSEARGFQFVERARKIGDEGDRDKLEGSRCGFGENAVEGRAMPARHDEAARAENRRRSQNRADVMRVGHLIENDERTSACLCGKIMPIGFGQGFDVEGRSLVHGIGA